MNARRKGIEMKKFLAIALVASLMLCLSGCAQEQAPKNEPSDLAGTKVDGTETRDDLVLVDSSFFKDDYGWVNMCAVVKNPNSNFMVVYPTIKATVRDSKGAVLSVEDCYCDYVLPGENAVVIGSFSGESLDIASIDYSITAGDDSWGKVDSETIRVSDFVVSGQSEVANDYGKRSWVGEVTNNSGNDYDGYTAAVILKNGGKVVSGFSSIQYDAPIAAGDTVPFDIESEIIGESYPDYDSYEIAIYPIL